MGRKKSRVLGDATPNFRIRTGVVQQESWAGKKVNRNFSAGQEEIPGPFLMPENNFYRKE